MYDLYIHKLSYSEEIDKSLGPTYMRERGFISAWKFCKNTSHLHLLGGSSLNGKIFLQNSFPDDYNYSYPIEGFKFSKCINKYFIIL